MFYLKRFLLMNGDLISFNFIKEHLPKRFLLFLVVGVANAAFGYGLFAVLIYFKVHYSLASLISTILGVLFNFKSTGIIVFKNKNNLLIFRYFLAYGICYLLGLLFLFITNYFNISNYIAAALWLFPGAVISYFLMKAMVFRLKESK